MTRSSSLLSLLAITVCLAIAGDTGKVRGSVVDAETGEPLAGANIVIVGTSLGAASDLDGVFNIINILPGTYDVRVSMVGYATRTFTGVRVMADVTTELPVTLSTQAIEQQEIVVTAERSVVQRDQTSTRAIVEGSTIVRDLRFQQVNEVLELQAGVTRGTDGALHVRGGRTGGMVYQIDGIPMLNPFTRTAAADFEVENVQELQAHLGTFDAEYGNAADGIVTVYTKDGGDRYKGRFTYESPMLNSSLYHEKDWNLQRDEVAALSAEEQKLYKDHVRKPDGTSAYDWMSVLDDPYVEDELIIPALGTWSASLGGPVPLIDGLTFYSTGRLRNDNSYLPFGYTLFRSLSMKLTYPVTSLMKARVSFDWSKNTSQNYDHTYKYWRWWDSGLDTLGRKGNYPIDRSRSHRLTFSLKHMLSQSTFYDVSAAWVRDFSSWTVPDRTVVYDETTGELISSDYLTRLYVGGNDSNFMYGDVRYWRETENSQYLLKGNLESQVDNNHQLRTGFELKAHTMSRHRIGMPPRQNLEFFDKAATDGISSLLSDLPFEGAFYVQDKVEYSFMILKVGLRVDYFDPRAYQYPDASDILDVVTLPGGSVEYVAVNKEAVKPHLQISPRIGIAHPISDMTSIHFAYGHYFQTPRFYDLFRNDALNDILVNDALIGNPGLAPERTTAFEIGLQQQLSDDWSMNVTAYSKDIENLTSTYYYFTGRDYTIYINQDYGRVQGLDISLNKRMSSHLSGRLTYTLMYALGNMSDPSEGYSYREEDAALRPNRNFPLDFDQRHKINLTTTMRFEPLTLTAIFNAGSGLPYTPTSRAAEESNIVPEPNSARRPWTFNLDLKFSWDVLKDPVGLTVFADIDNVFDAVNTRFIWSRTGESWNEGPTSVRPKDRQANPENVYPPRIIRAGFFVEF